MIWHSFFMIDHIFLASPKFIHIGLIIINMMRFTLKFAFCFCLTSYTPFESKISLLLPLVSINLCGFSVSIAH